MAKNKFLLAQLAQERQSVIEYSGSKTAPDIVEYKMKAINIFLHCTYRFKI
jgi:hypothetical protein